MDHFHENSGEVVMNYTIRKNTYHLIQQITAYQVSMSTHRLSNDPQMDTIELLGTMLKQVAKNCNPIIQSIWRNKDKREHHGTLMSFSPES